MMGADPQHPHENPGSIDMAPQVGALVIAEVPGLVPRSHKEAYNSL